MISATMQNEMVNQTRRDAIRRELCRKQELIRTQQLSIIRDLSLSPKTRFSSIQKLNLLGRNGSKTRLRNRCIATGRGRGVYRFCKLSRISFRELASKGLLMGVIKSSW